MDDNCGVEDPFFVPIYIYIYIFAAIRKRTLWLTFHIVNRFNVFTLSQQWYQLLGEHQCVRLLPCIKSRKYTWKKMKWNEQCYHMTATTNQWCKTCSFMYSISIDRGWPTISKMNALVDTDKYNWSLIIDMMKDDHHVNTNYWDRTPLLYTIVECIHNWIQYTHFSTWMDHVTTRENSLSLLLLLYYMADTVYSYVHKYGALLCPRNTFSLSPYFSSSSFIHIFIRQQTISKQEGRF